MSNYGEYGKKENTGSGKYDKHHSTNPDHLPPLRIPDGSIDQGLIKWWVPLQSKTCVKCNEGPPWMMHCVAIPGEGRYYSTGLYPQCSCSGVTRYQDLMREAESNAPAYGKGVVSAKFKQIGDLLIDTNTGEVKPEDEVPF